MSEIWHVAGSYNSAHGFFSNPYQVSDAAIMEVFLKVFLAVPGRWAQRLLALTLVAPMLGVGAQATRQDFALKDGDTVVFFGSARFASLSDAQGALTVLEKPGSARPARCLALLP